MVVPLGPMLYRLAYQPLAEASVLVLLIISVAVHFALVGLGLFFFGAEGSRTPAFSDASFQLGTLNVNGQTLWVLGASLATQNLLDSREGRAIRALKGGGLMAQSMGVNTTRAKIVIFLIAALLAWGGQPQARPAPNRLPHETEECIE